MSLNKKYILYTAISLVVLLFILVFISYYEVRKNAEEESFRICERLVAEVEASRSYVREVLRPKATAVFKTGEFIPEMMSASFVARSIFERFLKQYPNYHIKFASINPRNPINKADIVEQSNIDYFYSDISIKRWEGIVTRKGQEYFTVAKSFPLKKGCLRCHGDPNDAPKSLLAKYGPKHGFGMEVGDITMYSVGVPVRITYGDIWQRTFSKIWPVMLIVIVFFISITGIFKNLVGDPIEKLIHAVNHFAKGNYDSRVDISKVGKLKELAESYNSMADQLSEQMSHRKQTEKRLREQQAELEFRVEERTVELSEVNNSLKHKISILEIAEEKIKASLKEKETLLHEIHHRVKNNMAVISSLLSLQASSMNDEKLTTALMDSKNRVQSMTAIHETLYQSENLSSIDMKTYLSKLTRAVAQNYGIGSKVNIKVESEDILITVKQASPLGLIVNELITNSYKYAFPDNKEGEIKLGFKKKEDQIELIYADNGIGMPKDFDWHEAKSMGLNLVKILAEDQLSGSVQLIRGQGTCFIIKFKKVTS